MTRGLILGAILLVTGCAHTKAEDAQTLVVRDGFNAVQITRLPPDWSGTGKEIVTTCEWAHLAQSPVDKKWYCPGKRLIQDAQESHAHPLIITGNYMSYVIPAAGEAAKGAFTGLGFGLGLAYQRVGEGTNLMPGGSISTFVQCGAGQTFSGAGKAPGCQ